MSMLPTSGIPRPDDDRDDYTADDTVIAGNDNADDPRTEPDMDHANQLMAWIKSTNVAEDLDESELGSIGQRVHREYELDENSRADWKAKYDKWLDFAMQKVMEKTYPWPKASNVIFPLITSSALQFAARAYPAIIKNRDVVRGIVVGLDDSGAKKARADRVGEHMSWQCLDEMPEWETDTDKLLHILPVVGCVFRKSYFDPTLQRNVQEMVTADNICVNYLAKSFERVQRITEILSLYPVEVEERIRSGVFLDRDYGRDEDSSMDDDGPIKFLEQHRRLDLDGDGYPEPWIVTICERTQQVARIVAGFDDEGVKFGGDDHRIRKIDRVEYYTKYDFLPSIDGSIYGAGFGQYLFPINEAINSTLNQMLDAGHLQNTGGGFIGKGLSMNAGAVRFAPGEYKQVNTTGATIRESVFPLPFQGPSPVLFQLLGFLVSAGKDIASVKDVMMGENVPANMPATTILALIEQGMQVFSAIYKRVHRSLKSDFGKLYRLNRLYMDPQSAYRTGDEWKLITPADYAEGSGVEPVSDPKMVSDMQRLGKAQFLLQFLGNHRVDETEILTRAFEAANIDGIEKLLPNRPPVPDPKVLKDQAEQQLKEAELMQRGMHERAMLGVRQSRDKAAEIKDLAAAVLSIAQAHAAAHDTQQGWLAQQLDIMRFKLEQINGDDGNVDSDIDALGNPSGQQGGLPGMAPPPGQQGPVALPPGLPEPASPGIPG